MLSLLAERYPSISPGELNLNQLSALLDEDVIGPDSENLHFRTEADFERWLSRKLK